jgi:hypothetical protein
MRSRFTRSKAIAVARPTQLLFQGSAPRAPPTAEKMPLSNGIINEIHAIFAKNGSYA